MYIFSMSRFIPPQKSKNKYEAARFRKSKPWLFYRVGWFGPSTQIPIPPLENRAVSAILLAEKSGLAKENSSHRYYPGILLSSVDFSEWLGVDPSFSMHQRSPVPHPYTLIYKSQLHDLTLYFIKLPNHFISDLDSVTSWGWTTPQHLVIVLFKYYNRKFNGQIT